jgi:transposase
MEEMTATDKTGTNAARSVGYFGAVRLRDGRFFQRREDGRFNGQTFWDFLKDLHEANRTEGRRMVIISDNAKYRHARLRAIWREEQIPGFELDFLPAYSPGLVPWARLMSPSSRKPAKRLKNLSF